MKLSTPTSRPLPSPSRRTPPCSSSRSLEQPVANSLPSVPQPARGTGASDPQTRLNASNDASLTAVDGAAWANQNPASLEALLAAGVDLKTRADNARTLLHFAAQRVPTLPGHSVISDAATVCLLCLFLCAGSASAQGYGHPLFDDFVPEYCDPNNFDHQGYAQWVLPIQLAGRQRPQNLQPVRYVTARTDDGGGRLVKDQEFFTWLTDLHGRFGLSVVDGGPSRAYRVDDNVVVLEKPPRNDATYSVYHAQLLPITDGCDDYAREREKLVLWWSRPGYTLERSGDCPTGSLCSDVPSNWPAETYGSRTRVGWLQGTYTHQGTSNENYSYPVRARDGLRASILMLFENREGSSMVRATYHLGGSRGDWWECDPRCRVRVAGIGQWPLYVDATAEYYDPNEGAWRWAKWLEGSTEGRRQYVGRFGIAYFFGPDNPEAVVKVNDLCSLNIGVALGVAAMTDLHVRVTMSSRELSSDGHNESLGVVNAGTGALGFYGSTFDLCDP